MVVWTRADWFGEWRQHVADLGLSVLLNDWRLLLKIRRTGPYLHITIIALKALSKVISNTSSR